MITPVKLNSLNSTRVNFASQEAGQQEGVKANLKEKALNVRKGFIGLLKGVNDVKGTTQGVARGVVEGTAATALVATVAKSLKESKNYNVFEACGKTLSTLGNVAKSLVKFIPKIVTEAPVDNVKSIVKQPVHFYKNFLKGHKVIALASTVAGLGVLAFRAVQGKFKANKSNSEIDHYITNKGHKE